MFKITKTFKGERSMDYQSIQMSQKICINEIFTIHYFEYMSDFTFPGEKHDFWEILCVDKGEVIVQANECEYILKEGDIIFHEPNEFHNIRANRQIAPNLVVISFKCNSRTMKAFSRKIFATNSEEKILMGQIIHEAEKTYTNVLGDPYYKKLYRRETTPFASEQLIKLYLEHILIGLYRRYLYEGEDTSIPYKEIWNDSKERVFYEQIHSYLTNKIPETLTLNQICEDNLIGISKIQKIIKKQHGCGVIDYYNKLKVEKAKQLIRNGHMNFSQISEYMGYSTIHYFSKQFKQITSMTPTQYASSIRKVVDEQSGKEYF